MTPDAVVIAARRWLGVRFHHQGRSAAGVDCVGLLVAVARELGLVAEGFDVNEYARAPDGSMRRLCDAHLLRTTAPEFGGAVLMRINDRTRAQHIGLVGRVGDALTLIHADDTRARRVTEVRLQFGRHMSLVQAYRLPGVAY